jgi:phosphoglycerate kinase
MPKKTIAQIGVNNRRVLTRVDFNVPIEGGVIGDDRRIREALPTLRSVLDRGGSLILMSHLGRPQGKGVEPEFSLRPVAKRLSELLARPVAFPSQDCTDDAAAKAAADAKPGQVILLENVRFAKGEKKGEPAYAARLASYADIYCNDAFGTAHRNDASMLAVPQAMTGKPRVAGLLLQKELKYLADALLLPARPFVAVLGGAKVSDKLGAIANLCGKVNTIIVGGAMAYTFLKAQGHDVGASLVQDDMLGQARKAIEAATAGKTELLLPVDHVCGKAISATTPTAVHRGSIPAGWMGLDIGPETAARYAGTLAAAKTIVWNGPMGVFETPPFDTGTRAVAAAMTQATRSGAVTIVGGGDTAAAVDVFHLNDGFSHVSTGGGASLEMLEGKAFASVAALDEA